MRKVTLEDLSGLSRYAGERDGARSRIIEIKRARRVSIGDRVTVVFENFETIRFQVQEMVFVERITDIDEIREECAVYNALLPGDRELSATLFVEVTDQASIADELNRLIGIDEHVVLSIDGIEVPARFEPGRTREDRISAVQYVRFPLSGRRFVPSGGPGARFAFGSNTRPTVRKPPSTRPSERVSRPTWPGDRERGAAVGPVDAPARGDACGPRRDRPPSDGRRGPRPCSPAARQSESRDDLPKPPQARIGRAGDRDRGARPSGAIRRAPRSARSLPLPGLLGPDRRRPGRCFEERRSRRGPRRRRACRRRLERFVSRGLCRLHVP